MGRILFSPLGYYFLRSGLVARSWRFSMGVKDTLRDWAVFLTDVADCRGESAVLTMFWWRGDEVISFLLPVRKSRSCWQVGLALGSSCRHHLMMVLTLSLVWTRQGRGSLRIWRQTSAMFLPSSKVFPLMHSQKVTPIAQISVFSLYQFSKKASGAIQEGEPTLQSREGLRWPSIWQYPKSMIFTWPSSMRMFAGFRSRCRMPLLTSPSSPRTISYSICRERSWERGPLLSKDLRDPPRQSSVTRQQQCASWTAFSPRRTCGPSDVMRAVFSMRSRYSVTSLSMDLSSMTFTATYVLSLRLRPRKTSPVAPLPRDSPFSTRYSLRRLMLAELLIQKMVQELQNSHLPTASDKLKSTFIKIYADSAAEGSFVLIYSVSSLSCLTVIAQIFCDLYGWASICCFKLQKGRNFGIWS